MSDENTSASIQTSGVSHSGEQYVPYMPFEEYQERFKRWFSIRREGGIIEVKHHLVDDPDKPAQWVWGIHKGWGQLLKLIGQDTENEVLIMSGTGDEFLTRMDPESIKTVATMAKQDTARYLDGLYPQYRDGTDLLYNMVYDVHIPTISVINGPSVGHTEFPLMADLTLCTPDTVFQDGHYTAGVVPGDGQHLIFNFLAGYKRANYLAYSGKGVSAETAKEWGVVNEVLPLDAVMDRAWTLAHQIMEQPRAVRRLSHDMIRQPLRRALDTDFPQQFALEWYGAAATAYEPIKISAFNDMLKRDEDDII